MTTVIYHKSDFDGIFSMQIAKKFLKNTEKELHFLGWDYGDPVPKILKDENVYLLDLSIPEIMDNPNLIWIDHHKTAIDKHSKDIKGYRIDGVAACRLTWQWFMLNGKGLPVKNEYIKRDVFEPEAVRLIGEFDVWDKTYPEVDLFQYGICAENLEDVIGDLLTFYEGLDKVAKIVENGKIIQKYNRNENEKIMARSFTIEWENLIFLCLNHAKTNSLVFESAVKPYHDGLLSFFYNGEVWKFSLYGASKKDVDLSVIAKKYGGGGHKQACGFELKNLPEIFIKS